MFLDASAIVAILNGEDTADLLLDRIEGAEGAIYYSSLVVFEAVIALSRQAKIAKLGDHASTPPDFIRRANFGSRTFG